MHGNSMQQIKEQITDSNNNTDESQKHYAE